MNWVEVEPAGGGAEKLPAGAYVLRITDASDHTARSGAPYLTLVYDVAEGEHANHFAGESREYVHSFNRSYGGKSKPFFKSLLEAFEQSNPGRFNIETWQRTCDERALVGLTVGVLFRDRIYTNNKGRDVTVLDYVRPMSADEVRAGAWTVPPVKDDRDSTPGGGYVENPYGQQEQAPTSVYDADVPF